MKKIQSQLHISRVQLSLTQLHEYRDTAKDHISHLIFQSATWIHHKIIMAPGREQKVGVSVRDGPN